MKSIPRTAVGARVSFLAAFATAAAPDIEPPVEDRARVTEIAIACRPVRRMAAYGARRVLTRLCIGLLRTSTSAAQR
jgi:hypothetical protein